MDRNPVKHHHRVERHIVEGNPYAHLPIIERPLPGQPTVEFRNGLIQYLERHQYLDTQIRKKREETMKNMNKKYPGNNAIFLTRPTEHIKFEKGPKKAIARKMAELIRNVYGKGYPLPNKKARNNYDSMISGKLLAYLGIIGPKGVVGVNGDVYNNPSILERSDIKSMAASAIILGDEGFAELGRFARRQQDKEFDGGSIILEMIYDWMRNRHGLMEGIHTLYADMRAANKHDHSPHSGNVQSLLLGHGGMGIVAAAPMYDVNGIEPMMKVALYRDPESVRKHNESRNIVLPTGVNTRFLRALWQNQLGVEPNIQEIPDNELGSSYDKAQIDYHGKHIYTGIRIGTETQTLLNMNLDEGLSKIPTDAPILFAQIEAETKESAATQKKLMKQGFIHCGIMPAQRSEYLIDPGNRNKGTAVFDTPATVFMVKLGEPIKKGEIKIADAYYPPPIIANNKELHGRHQMNGTSYVDGNYMRALLYENDQLIRDSINK